jgi:hypothetical protein
MRSLKNLVRVSAAGIVLACALSGAAYAQAKAPEGAPLGCKVWTPLSSSNLIGKSWSLKQKDDGYDWTGPWILTFTPDGKWQQAGTTVGSWCQSGDTVIFSFSSSPNTAYRGQVSSMTVSGYESWDGAGTGIFEMVVK